MTIPERIWIDENSEDDEGFVIGRFDQKYCNVDQCYIRSDIAEELARALEKLINGGCDVKAARTLARYRALTP